MNKIWVPDPLPPVDARRGPFQGQRAVLVTCFRCFVLATITLLLGCAEGGPQVWTPTEIRAAQRQSYPDAAGNRFVALADFEQDAPLTAFSVSESESEEASVPARRDRSRYRHETGRASMRVDAPNVAHPLVLDLGTLAPSARDWSDYTLLLFSADVASPGPDARLTVHVLSEDDRGPGWERTFVLHRPWQTVRVDLAEVGNAVDLKNVSAIRWWLEPPNDALRLNLDDLLLIDDTRWIVGPSTTDGHLSVSVRGGRLHVASRDRFELTFADGVLERVSAILPTSIAAPQGLGPWLLPADANRLGDTDFVVACDDPEIFASWGRAVRSSQRLVEHSTARVVVDGEWEFISSDTDRRGPRLIWRYTVYPNGNVFCRLLADPADNWPASASGVGLTYNGRIPWTVESLPREVARAAILRRTESETVLWATEPATTRPRLYDWISADRNAGCLFYVQEPLDALDSVHYLRIGPSGPSGDHAMVQSWLDPLSITCSSGRVRGDQPGDRNHDGFNESEGCYELEMTDHVLRAELGPIAPAYDHVVLRIHGARPNERVTAALSGRLLGTDARDANGNLLLTLPETLRSPKVLEVFRNPRRR